MNKKKILNALSWVVLSLVILFIAYTKGWIIADFASIDPKDAYTLMHDDNNVSLLDVRTDDEYNQEHIDGAIHIPLQTLAGNMDQLTDAKDKKIIVYCHSGNRSVSASRILAKQGFHPYNMNGGISQWKRDGLAVTNQ